MNRLKEMVEGYLQGKGFDLSVSTALKLVIDPGELSCLAEQGAKHNVFTAFRDTKTYESRERVEMPPKLYSVNRNSDFVYCANGKSFYIFNASESKNAYDYQNENERCSQFYNAGVTVTVRSEGSELAGPSIIYGFLACDVLNKK